MRAKRKAMAEINVVPYIDVMLVLLIIFMITAPLLSPGVNVELPRAAAKPLAQQQEPIVVSIDRTGAYYLNIATNPEQPIAANLLQQSVGKALMLTKQQNQVRPVFIKGDSHVSYDKVMQAMVLLQQAGAESVGLLTQNRNYSAP